MTGTELNQHGCLTHCELFHSEVEFLSLYSGEKQLYSYEVQEVTKHICHSLCHTYLCPDSWAIVKAKPSPVSSLIVQLLYLLHIPLIGAKPVQNEEGEEVRC